MGLALACAGCSSSSPDPVQRTTETGKGNAGRASAARSARATCAGRSEADFPGGFTKRANLVVGPLSMSGGRLITTEATVREFGGNKFPLLVKDGHTVTVEIAVNARHSASLAYGPLPEGEVELRDGHHSVTFVACPVGGPSESHADAEPVTFWSGFVLVSEPLCVPLDVYIDGAEIPRRANLTLGKRCQGVH